VHGGAVKAVMSGRTDEIIDLAKTSVALRGFAATHPVMGLAGRDAPVVGWKRAKALRMQQVRLA